MTVALAVAVGLAAVGGIGLRAGRRHRVRQRLGIVRPGEGSAAAPQDALVRWLGARLAAADLALLPERVVRWWGAGLVAVPLVWLAFGPVAGTLAVLCAVAGPPLGLWLARGRRAERLDRELPTELDRLASAVRAGATVRGALQSADPASADGPAAVALAEVGGDLRRGRPFAEAVDAFAARQPSRATSLVATSLVLAATAGGSPARALDGAAATLHERREAERDLRAAAAQARLSALVISVAPLGFAALAAGTDPRVLAFLLGSPAGVACLLLGLGLDAVAAWWMHRIVAEPR